MTEWVNSALDMVLIVAVLAGLVQVTRLIRQLAGLKQGRLDMERFVHEFNTTVLRAESGIKNLKTAARESGDDLEKLLEKADQVSDELRFIVESADQLANRITDTAALAAKTEANKSASKTNYNSIAETKSANVSPLIPMSKTEPIAEPSSRAEKELLQALQKLK